MLSIVAFLLGNNFVRVQVVPGNFIGCPVSTLSKSSSNLSGETSLLQRLLEILQGWDLQIPIVYNF